MRGAGESSGLDAVGGGDPPKSSCRPRPSGSQTMPATNSTQKVRPSGIAEFGGGCFFFLGGAGAEVCGGAVGAKRPRSMFGAIAVSDFGLGDAGKVNGTSMDFSASFFCLRSAPRFFRTGFSGTSGLAALS